MWDDFQPVCSIGLCSLVETQPASGIVRAIVNMLGTIYRGDRFNCTAAVFKVASGSKITATVPSGVTTGGMRVVTPSGGLSSSVSFQVCHHVGRFLDFHMIREVVNESTAVSMRVL